MHLDQGLQKPRTRFTNLAFVSHLRRTCLSKILAFPMHACIFDTNGRAELFNKILDILYTVGPDSSSHIYWKKYLSE